MKYHPNKTPPAPCFLTAISRPAPTSCESPSVLCLGTSVCMSQGQLCDGRRDCPDGSDEASCIDACASPGKKFSQLKSF